MIYMLFKETTFQKYKFFQQQGGEGGEGESMTGGGDNESSGFFRFPNGGFPFDDLVSDKLHKNRFKNLIIPMGLFFDKTTDDANTTTQHPADHVKDLPIIHDDMFKQLFEMVGTTQPQSHLPNKTQKHKNTPKKTSKKKK